MSCFAWVVSRIIFFFYFQNFEHDGETLVGEIKIPRTVKYDDEILYTLKNYINKYKGKLWAKVPSTNNLIGITYNLKDITTDSIIERYEREKLERENDMFSEINKTEIQLYKCGNTTVEIPCPGELSNPNPEGLQTRCYKENKTGWTNCADGWKLT